MLSERPEVNQFDFFLARSDFAPRQPTRPLFQLCNSDELWEILYLDHMGAEHVGDELRSLAEAVGWKKLFFTNKLQLQVCSAFCFFASTNIVPFRNLLLQRLTTNM